MMKKHAIILLGLVALISCSTHTKKTPNWENSKNILTPESALYDANSGKVYVSNIDGAGDGKDQKGHISILDKKGNTLDAKWLTGLNAPKGSRIYKDSLWIADINRVVKVNLNTGKVMKMIYIKGAKFLNDIAIDDNGVVYVSDTIGSKIYKIKNNSPSVFVKGAKYTSPNGLLIKGRILYVASWGLTTDWSTKTPGHLYALDLESKLLFNITKKPLGNLDGLEFDRDGNFIVSDWVSGDIYKVTLEGEVTHLFKGSKGTADIAVLPESKKIIIPSMLENKVYSIDF